MQVIVTTSEAAAADLTAAAASSSTAHATQSGPDAKANNAELQSQLLAALERLEAATLELEEMAAKQAERESNSNAAMFPDGEQVQPEVVRLVIQVIEPLSAPSGGLAPHPVEEVAIHLGMQVAEPPCGPASFVTRASFIDKGVQRAGASYEALAGQVQESALAAAVVHGNKWQQECSNAVAQIHRLQDEADRDRQSVMQDADQASAGALDAAVRRADYWQEQYDAALAKLARLEGEADSNRQLILELEAQLQSATRAAAGSRDGASAVQPRLSAALESMLHIQRSSESNDGSEAGKEEMSAQLEAARNALALLADEIGRQEEEQDGHTTSVAVLMQQLVSMHQQVQDLQAEVQMHVKANAEARDKLDEVEGTLSEWEAREMSLVERARELEAERSAVASNLETLQGDLDAFQAQHAAVAALLQSTTQVCFRVGQFLEPVPCN